MEIRKLLVANRGEIAARIFSTCDRLGIATVAVRASDDAGAFHTRRAAEVEEVPGYLDIEGVVAAARAPLRTRSTPATASWPRTPASPRRSSRPASGSSARRPTAIRAAGDKLEAKRLAAEAGVPVVRVGDPDEVGYPLW